MEFFFSHGYFVQNCHEDYTKVCHLVNPYLSHLFPYRVLGVFSVSTVDLSSSLCLIDPTILNTI